MSQTQPLQDRIVSLARWISKKHAATVTVEPNMQQIIFKTSTGARDRVVEKLVIN